MELVEAVDSALPGEVSEHRDLDRIIAEQRRDDVYVVASDARVAFSLDACAGTDEDGNSSAYGDRVGIDPDTGDVNAPRDRDKHPKFAGPARKSWWDYPFPTRRERARCVDELRRDFAWYQAVTTFAFATGRGRRPEFEKHALAAWLWRWDLHGVPRAVLERVTGRSQQSIADLIGYQQAKRLNEVHRPRLWCEWIPSTLVSGGQWRYWIEPGTARDGSRTYRTFVDGEAVAPRSPAFDPELAHLRQQAAKAEGIYPGGIDSIRRNLPGLGVANPSIRFLPEDWLIDERDANKSVNTDYHRRTSKGSGLAENQAWVARYRSRLASSGTPSLVSEPDATRRRSDDPAPASPTPSPRIATRSIV